MRSTPKTWAAKEARETATTAQVPACACHLDDRLRQSLVLLQQCVQVASGNVLQDEPYMAASSIPVVELQRVGVPQFVHDVHLVLDLRTTRSAWHANWRMPRQRTLAICALSTLLMATYSIVFLRRPLNTTDEDPLPTSS